jgi:mannose-1-phosphate guanylyltransferase
MVRFVQQTIPLERIFVMAVANFGSVILEQVPNLPPENILIEPAQRDTGPALIFGLAQVHAHDPEACVASFWADHLILDITAFSETLAAAFTAVEAQPSRLVIMGATPTKPDTTLGYIHKGEAEGDLYRVKSFVEKPDSSTAAAYLQSGDYLWNVGYSIVQTGVFMEEVVRLNPEHAQVITNLYTTLAAHYEYPEEKLKALAHLYEQLPKTSIEYLYTQKVKDIFVIPTDMGWSDIGTWTTLHKMMIGDSTKRLVTQGEVHSINTENSLVFAKDRPITLVGVKDLIVVDTGDTILVMHHDAPANDLKKLVQDTLTNTNPELL